jgi:FSR family fosmidomycin resistance protein-like MFS transporter
MAVADPAIREERATSVTAPAAAAGVRRTTAIRRATGLSLLVAFAHGVNDSYAAFLAPLLPRIMDKLELGVALAATLAMVLSIAASLLQPLAGFLADRYGRRVFVALGPLLSAIFLSLIGLAPTFGLLVLLLALGGLGSALFHPPGASMAARIAEGRGSGMRLSVFSFGGAMGFAVGPIVAVGIVGQMGLEGLWIAMVPGVLLGILLLRLLPADRLHPNATPPPAPAKVLRQLRGPLGVIFLISALGAFIQRVFLTLEPIAAAQAGVSEATGAVILSVYLAAQGAGTLTSGWLTDRVDRRHLLVVLTLLAFPAHFMAFWVTPGSSWTFAFAIAAGFLNMALLPPIVVMAQEILPEGTAVSSGIVMGLAWALGSVGVLGSGLLGDIAGARTAALASFPLILVGTLLALHPAIEAYRRPTPHPDFDHLPIV